DPLDLQHAAARPAVRRPERVRPVSPDAQLARRLPAGARARAPDAVRRRISLLRFFLLLTVPSLAAAQSERTAVQRAESLHAAGRPWHAAETLLAAAAREPHQNAEFIVLSARAELRARRYDRARSLLAGQPWLDDYGDGEALAILAEAETHLGASAAAAAHFVAARARASGPPPSPPRPPPPPPPHHSPPAPPCRRRLAPGPGGGRH